MFTQHARDTLHFRTRDDEGYRARGGYRYYDPYEYDWDTGAMVSKVDSMFAVTPGGVIYLTANCEGDPETRRLLTNYGVDIRNAKDLPTLYEPGTSTRVAKSALNHGTYLWWADRVYSLKDPVPRPGKARVYATWTTPDTRPEVYNKIVATRRDPAAETALVEKFAEQVVLGDALLALEQQTMEHHFVKHSFSDARALVTGSEATRKRMMSLAFQLREPRRGEFLFHCTAKVTKFDYLVTERNHE